MIKNLLKGLAMQAVTPLDWIISHLSFISWPAAVGAAWYLRGVFKDMADRARTMEEHVEKMSTNCFPTMQASLQSIDETLQRQETRWDAWLAAQVSHSKQHNK